MSQVTVEWGDGQSDQVTVDGDEQAWSFDDQEHTYADPGRYTITVIGLSGGQDTATVVAIGPADPIVTVGIPAHSTMTSGEEFPFTTTLTNTGGAVEEATETIRLSVDDGTLAPDDVVYQTEDDGIWTALTFAVVDAQTIESNETYPIPAGLDATSDVKVTITKPDGTVVKGHSSIKDGDDTLATADYDFTVAAAP